MKDYIENHVRFLDDDGMTITVLCTKGDIRPFLKDRLADAYAGETKPKNLGYVVADVAATFLGHLVRPDVLDDMVEFVYYVTEVDKAPFITCVKVGDPPEGTGDEVVFEGYA